MDDEPDRAYSRAPELEDLVALCRALREAGVRYLLIGGFAVILHGFVRTTVDLMASACGIIYEDAIRQDTEERRIDDVVIPLAGKQLLIRMKDTARDSDRMDVRFLRWRIEDDGPAEE